MNENQMTYPAGAQNEEEIDLVALMMTLLHQLKPILLTAVVCAILATGLGVAKNAYSSYAASKAENSGDGTVVKSSAQRAYEEKLVEYREEKTEHDSNVQEYESELLKNQQTIESMKVKIENTKEYLEKSVLNSINPYNVHVAQADMYVATDYKILPGMEYQNVDYTDAVLQAYSSLMINSETMGSIAKSIGMEERYLRELVSVSGDSSTRLLTVRVYGSDDATTSKILNALLARMDAIQEIVESSVGHHSIAQLANTSTVQVLTWLRDSQQQNRENLTDLQNQVTTLEAADRVLQQSIEDEQQALDAMEPPEEVKTGTSVVKLVVLGFLLGGVLVCGVIVVRFLMQGKVYSGKELNETTGLPLLGTLASERTKKAGKLDAALNKMEGRPDGSGDEEMIRLMAVTVRSRAPEADSILVTGDLPAEQLNALAAALQNTDALRAQTVKAAESILQNAATVPQVTNADAIVLAADCTCSRYADVKDQTERIRRLGKNILGCIVFE